MNKMKSMIITGVAGLLALMGSAADALKSVEAANPVQEPAKVEAVKGTIQPGKGGLFFAGMNPATQGKDNLYDMGLKFNVDKDVILVKIHFYQSEKETGGHTFFVWSPEGKLMKSIEVPEAKGEGWYAVTLPDPLELKAGKGYIVGARVISWVGTLGAFRGKDKEIKMGDATAVGGIFAVASKGKALILPTTALGNNYFFDVEFAK